MKIYRSRQATFVALLLILTACGGSGGGGTERFDVTFSHYKGECFGAFIARLCKLDIGAGADNPTNFFLTVNGFNYEWGYTHRLTVRQEQIPNPPQDAPSVRYELIRIIDKQRVAAGTLFDISMTTDYGIQKVADGQYLLYDDKAFSCVLADCATLDSILAQDLAVLLEFQHADDPADALLLTQIKCSDQRETFRDSCLP